MILPLRQRHRRTFLALGIFLPVAFAVGIAARKPLPEIKSLPSEISPVSNSFAAEVWSRADLFPKSPVQTRLLREEIGTEKFAVAFSAANDFVRPDLLVYWSAGNAAVTNALPDNAILLGAFNSPQLPLPVAAQKTDGALVLYSLADNEIVDASQPIRFADSTR
jgi:hypothetical protein